MKVERSIDIPAPRELVWRLAHDPAERPLWDVRVAAFNRDAAPAAGAPFTITWRTPIVQCVAEGEYQAVEAPERSVARIGDASMPIVPPGTSTWLFEERKDGTRLTVRFESDARAEQAAPAFLVGLLVRRDLGRSLKNLRRMASESVGAEPVLAPVGLASSE